MEEDMVETNMRNGGLDALMEMLQQQHVRKVDVVAPASKIKSREGVIVIDGADAMIDTDGVTPADGLYKPTDVMIDGLAGKLGVPPGYLKKVHDSRPDLFDANVNGWLHGRRPLQRYTEEGLQTIRAGTEPDTRSFLVRTFKGDDGEPGIGRAFLSDQYKVVDNLDMLLSALDGIRAAGVNVQIAGCDLTHSAMHVRVRAPEVKAYATTLLKGYRSPYSGNSGDENPTVFAGFALKNSEVGTGAWTLTPRIEVQVCSNGMTIKKDVVRGVHIGGRLEAGIIRWSEETRKNEIALIRSRTADAVKTFLDVGYVTAAIESMEEKASRPVTDAEKTVKTVSKRLQFSDEQTKGILDHFIRGGQMTAGGVMQAVTSYAQSLRDADLAAEFEEKGLTALDLAAAN